MGSRHEVKPETVRRDAEADFKFYAAHPDWNPDQVPPSNRYARCELRSTTQRVRTKDKA